MMRRLLVVLALAGCPFASKHPAITAGITGGAIGLTGCLIDDQPAKTCALVGGGAARFLGGIAALVTLLADTTDHSLPPDENEQELTPRGAIRVHTKTALPPMTLDAGVDGGAATVAAPPAVDAATADAT